MIFTYIYIAIKRIIREFKRLNWVIVYFKFKINRISFHSDFKSNGIPILSINTMAKVVIGHSFFMQNGKYYNMIGHQQPCYFIVNKDAQLIIGNNVGISAAAIVCWNKIVIEDKVMIGGGTVIYDTDFHSLDLNERLSPIEDLTKIKTAPVYIRTGAFIGANCTLLKGVTIGENSIIGAASVVTKSIPPNEIWAGNPAKFIRKIS